jgi:hypothetical protein
MRKVEMTEFIDRIAGRLAEVLIEKHGFEPPRFLGGGSEDNELVSGLLLEDERQYLDRVSPCYPTISVLGELRARINSVLSDCYGRLEEPATPFKRRLGPHFDEWLERDRSATDEERKAADDELRRIIENENLKALARTFGECNEKHEDFERVIYPGSFSEYHMHSDELEGERYKAYLSMCERAGIAGRLRRHGLLDRSGFVQWYKHWPRRSGDEVFLNLVRTGLADLDKEAVESQLVPMLKEHFPGYGLQLHPEPQDFYIGVTARFPALYSGGVDLLILAELGGVALYIENSSGHFHFKDDRDGTTREERARKAVEETRLFLTEWFADRMLLVGDPRTTSNWEFRIVAPGGALPEDTPPETPVFSSSRGLR